MNSLDIATTCEVSCISQVTLWGDLCELFAALFEEEFGTERFFSASSSSSFPFSYFINIDWLFFEV